VTTVVMTGSHFVKPAPSSSWLL